MLFVPPIDDILLTIATIAGRRWQDNPTADLLASGEARAVLEQSGAFVADTLAPLNRQGDKWGAMYEEHNVTLPDGWPQAYRAWAAAGWNGISLPEAYGGAGLPVLIGTAAMEMMTSANMALSTLPVLTQGAADALALHGSETLKNTYLAKLVSGQWTATMNLTEPQAGSDLGLLATRAVPAGDGTCRIIGNKIFITFGEHDLAENIIHLVLARLPDAPEGTRGISLFLVPKFLPDRQGNPGARNDLTCTGVEHKLGIKASPTCMMSFGDHGGATGWLIGHPNNGLACMFTMMNKARLATGLQGVAIAERATQKALAYAQERKQGRAPGVAGPAPIARHPDVQRMLGRMQVLTTMTRALAYLAADAIDEAAIALTPEARAAAEVRAGLLTPIVKAFCTDAGVEVASLGVQIHGGMGYVEETGAAQYFRDARIAPIYEGTNGIQAIDLVMRKLAKGGAAALHKFMDEGRDTISRADWLEDWTLVGALVGSCAATTEWMAAPQRTDAEKLYAASHYLRLCALAIGGALLVAAANRATGAQQRRFQALARIFAADFAPEGESLAISITRLGNRTGAFAAVSGLEN